MQQDGNLVLLNDAGKVLWHPGTAPNPDVKATMQRDGKPDGGVGEQQAALAHRRPVLRGDRPCPERRQPDRPHARRQGALGEPVTIMARAPVRRRELPAAPVCIGRDPADRADRQLIRQTTA